MPPPAYNLDNSTGNWAGPPTCDRLSVPTQNMVADKDSAIEHKNNVSRMFHRNNFRSLSLASGSDVTKTQLVNYVNQFIGSKKNGLNGNASSN